MTETTTVSSVDSIGRRVALTLICVVVALNLFVTPVGTSLLVNLISAALIAVLLVVVTRRNRRAQVIAFGLLGVVLALTFLSAAWT